jgi:5'-3' exonuclease
MKILHLVDSSIYIFRAYFSLPESLVDVDGHAVNAVRGYADFICQLKQAARSEHFVFAFDESLTTSFRNEIYPEYKANRELPPENLAAQLTACRRLTDILGFKTCASNRFEADDLIGTVAHKMRTKGYKMRYITGDKDLAQLVQPGDQWWNFARKEKLGRIQIKNHLGVWPEQVVDLLALMGDAVDNIPGVPGIGAKTAALLLEKFRHLEGIYQQLHKIPDTRLRGAKRIQELLDQHRDQAWLSQQLARINENAPIRCMEASLKKKRVKRNQLLAFCDQHNFGERLQSRLLAV